jgi:hypothetical protein
MRSWIIAIPPENIMPTASRCQRLMARFVVCTCAILSACGQSRQDDAVPSRQASASSNDTTQALQPNELQSWARQATSGESPQADHAAVARNTSDALAAPVIHTVD